MLPSARRSLPAIQILSLIPDPKIQPYFRKFLRNSAASKDIPNIIANAFVKGTTWKRPSGPGHHCTLIIHTLLWCDPSLGDDGKASVDAGTRASLVAIVQGLAEDPRMVEREPRQSREMQRLLGVLQAIESLPGAQYVNSTREYLLGSGGGYLRLAIRAMRRPSFRAPSARRRGTCGKECQSWHWKHWT
ncbi:hypothetical protein C8R46DRAFT_282803 [Mycena filopes]|nr:hypothetical protein C8R46DRAFT_282803 [Mycena filopes]